MTTFQIHLKTHSIGPLTVKIDLKYSCPPFAVSFLKSFEVISLQLGFDNNEENKDDISKKLRNSSTAGSDSIVSNIFDIKVGTTNVYNVTLSVKDSNGNPNTTVFK
jgi:hypothetical protein